VEIDIRIIAFSLMGVGLYGLWRMGRTCIKPSEKPAQPAPQAPRAPRRQPEVMRAYPTYSAIYAHRQAARKLGFPSGTYMVWTLNPARDVAHKEARELYRMFYPRRSLACVEYARNPRAFITDFAPILKRVAKRIHALTEGISLDSRYTDR
jgi:hypothetical protein